MMQVDEQTVQEFARLCGELEREAGKLERLLRAKGQAHRLEGAETVRANARMLRERALTGQLSVPESGVLPLNRPFAEWDYGTAAKPVWRCIDAVDDFWDEQLGGGVFEVRDRGRIA